MCGIIGYAGFHEPGLADQMCAALTHRGPDSSGVAEFPENRISIGMRRLAIIDLTTGDQPITDESGLVSLVFNGEIYNYQELRSQLRDKGRRFHTNGDAEVVLQAYLEWGKEAWARLEGMFSIAIVDRRHRKTILKLVRDRVGIKPLYYILNQARLLFSSEVKAFTRWSSFDNSINLDSVSQYMALRYVPGPGSMFEQVQKAPAGHEISFEDGSLRFHQYWHPPRSDVQQTGNSAAASIRDIGEALTESVRRHMISDVPIGAFLSGGIDSNIIVALMAAASSSPIRTYSIGFEGFDRADMEGAARTAKAVGSMHTEIECRSEDFLKLPDIAWALDEPVGDPIIVPMGVLSREARKDVKVVLSGEGADEILGGYMFHRKLLRMAQLRKYLPGFVWPLSAAMVSRTPPALLDKAFDYPGQLGEHGRAKIADLLGGVGSSSLADQYRSAISLFTADEIGEASAGRLPPLNLPPLGTGTGTNLQKILALQYPDWLPDDILMKADKMSMMHSLECRVPFMDSLVIEAAARCPDHHKITQGSNKWVLRQFARKLLGDQAASAPKRAFYAPLEHYMKDRRFSEMISHTLEPARLRRRGIIDPKYVALLQSQLESGGFLPEKQLFSILMLEMWFEQYCPDASWA